MALYERPGFKSKFIDITGDDEFVKAVIFMLDKLYELKSKDRDTGKNFLEELDGAKKKITIRKGNSMQCRALGEPSYKLLSSWRQGDHATARKELDNAIKKSVWKETKKLAEQLSLQQGPSLSNIAFTPDQLKVLKIEIGKVVKLVGPKDVKIADKLTVKDWNKAQEQWASAIDTYLQGGNLLISEPQRAHLARKLEPWLTPGAGCACTIDVNMKSNETTCHFDGTSKKRPLAIGLAHELVHAYYSVTGTRLYVEGTIEDEALTTGLPPEHMRPYSENVFRSLWPEEHLDLRLFYSWGQIVAENACQYCGYRNDAEVKDPKTKKWVPRSTCAHCKKPFPIPEQVKNKLAALKK